MSEKATPAKSVGRAFVAAATAYTVAVATAVAITAEGITVPTNIL